MAFERSRYLQPSELCDFDKCAGIGQKAGQLIQGCSNRRERFEKIFSFVKEMPYGLEDWDLKASDIMHKGWGMCSGKTNLLVALLRSVGIPARYRVYRIHADTALWGKFGQAGDGVGRLNQLGQERDHVDCEVWLGRWIDCDPGRDSAMEKGIVILGGRLERKVAGDGSGRSPYTRLANFDRWARDRQAARTFRSDRAEVFADVNRGIQKLRELGSSA